MESRPGRAAAVPAGWGAAVAAYGVGVGLTPWLPPWGVAVAGAGSVAGLALAGARGGAAAAGAWLPLHLLLISTGGLSSPLLPVVAGWPLLVTRHASFRAALAFSAAAGALLAASAAWVGGPGAGALAEGALALAVGLAAGRAYHELRERTAAEGRRLEGILAEAGSGRSGGEEAEAANRVAELEAVVDTLRKRLGAEAAALWVVDPAQGEARARLAVGRAPPGTASLAGDPLGWASSEGLCLRLEAPPLWAAASGPAAVVPVDAGAGAPVVLSLEYGPGSRVAEVAALEEAALYLGAFLRMQQWEAWAVAARERVVQVLEALRRLPRQLEPEAYGLELAESARVLAGGSGAAVAEWDEEGGRGRVLAVAGEDGGPAPGSEFGAMESELALAARGESLLVRERRRGGLPVVAPGERWLRDPRALVVLPLRDPAGRVLGVLGTWCSDRPRFEEEEVAVLETIAPYAALQLEHARAYGALREDAERDVLTGLHNRRAFEGRLAEEVSRHQRYRRPLGLLLLDIDHFKAINDRYGHEAGDAVLKAVAEALRGSLRETDFTARFGGEEFVALLPETGLAASAEAGERVRRRIEALTVNWQGHRIPVTASVGASACPECLEDPRGLVRSADAMLYAAKDGGRNRLEVASPRRATRPGSVAGGAPDAGRDPGGRG